MILVTNKDCNVSRKGTGTISCEIPTGVPTGFFLAKKTWTLTVATDDFDNAYINANIKNKNLVPFLDAINFTDNSEEPVIFTTQLGVKLLARDGKPEFSFDFSKGYAFHSAAWSYNSFGDYNVIFTYDNGVVFMAQSSDGLTLKGHSAGLVNTGNFTHKDGAESEKTTVMYQLTNANEYNSEGALLDPVQNSFDIDTIKGIVDAKISHISNATVEVVVKVVAAANNAIPITGLLFTDFRATGTALSIDSLVYSTITDEYTLTFSADVSTDYGTGIVIDLYDSGDDTTVVTVATILYQGQSPSSA